MRALLITLLISWASLSNAASTKLNNDMIKECLLASGYDYNLPVEERLNTHDWNSSAACVSNYEVEKQQENVAQIQKFLKEKPWYKGRNWRWELRAEYRCTIMHSDVGPREVCSKPAYVQ